LREVPRPRCEAIELRQIASQKRTTSLVTSTHVDWDWPCARSGGRTAPCSSTPSCRRYSHGAMRIILWCSRRTDEGIQNKTASEERILALRFSHGLVRGALHCFSSHISHHRAAQTKATMRVLALSYGGVGPTAEAIGSAGRTAREFHTSNRHHLGQQCSCLRMLCASSRRSCGAMLGGDASSRRGMRYSCGFTCLCVTLLGRQGEAPSWPQQAYLARFGLNSGPWRSGGSATRPAAGDPRFATPPPLALSRRLRFVKSSARSRLFE